MDIILNEYIIEDYTRTTPEGFVKIFYEPCDKKPAKELSGLICTASPWKSVQDFNVKENELEIQIETLVKKREHAISGVFIPSERLIIMTWNKHPGEHCLCVSYEYEEENNLSRLELDWLQEGF